MNLAKDSILSELIWLRLSQIYINELYKKGDFKIPIHLALGHELIAIAVDHGMSANDSLFLTHRNIHYNLARLKSVREDLDEYYLKDKGLGKGMLGSMNLSNTKKNIIYSSSILGNNLCVGAGYAYANKVIDNPGVVFIVTGDGAIEEGAFYETLLFLSSNKLPSIIVVENNEWSLGTKIDERRGKIDLKNMSHSLGAEYCLLKGNDPFEYSKKIQSIRKESLSKNMPIVLEVELTTLGHWILHNEENPKGKFINYHAGPAPEVSLGKEIPVLDNSSCDPIFVIQDYVSKQDLLQITKREMDKIIGEMK